MKYKHYKVTIWERGKDKPITTEYHGEVTEQQLIDHYGLHEDDVEKYLIEEI